MQHLMRVAPELPVANLAQALDHYEQQLGFAIVMSMPTGDYAIVERDGVALHLYEDSVGPASPHSVHIFTTGLDELEAELRTRGAQITQAITRQPWGNRDFRVLDPSGNALKFTEPLAEHEWPALLDGHLRSRSTRRVGAAAVDDPPRYPIGRDDSSRSGPQTTDHRLPTGPQATGYRFRVTPKHVPPFASSY
jgi:uncharacterized glyoxalase superfamily protein PhnB